MIVDEGSTHPCDSRKAAHPAAHPDDPGRGAGVDGYLRVQHRGCSSGSCATRDEPNSSHDFGSDVIPHAIDDYACSRYPFVMRTGRQNYWRDVGTVDAYWRRTWS